MKKEDEYFTLLQNQYNGIISNETDTLVLKAIRQREILCDVSKEEYITAIEKLEGIINNNANNIEAVYAEIDILTILQGIDTSRTQIGKRKIGKYITGSSGEYLEKINQIIEKHIGDKLEKEKSIPEKYQLNQNYPNPFNPSTVISYQLPVNGRVSLRVYDILGKEIATLVDGYQSAGIYEIEFKVGQTSSLSSGVYFYRLQAGEFVETKKMMLLK